MVSQAHHFQYSAAIASRIAARTLAAAQGTSHVCKQTPGQGEHQSSSKRPPVVPASGTARTLLPCVGDAHPVAAFLRAHGCSQYAEVVIRNGFDDMDTLLDAEAADVCSMGLPRQMSARLVDVIQRERTRLYGSVVNRREHFDENNALVAFFIDIGLAQYAEPAFENGFYEMESLVHITDDDLDLLGIPRGHALKLRKRLREYCNTGDDDQHMHTEEAVYGAQRFTVPGDALKTAVASSWETVRSIGTKVVAEKLHKNFFGMVPEAMALFPPERIQKYRDWMADAGSSDDALNQAAMKNLWKRVVNVVGCTVAGLHDTQQLVPMLRQLGMRHINYGGSEIYWERAGSALILTLREMLGLALTPDVEQAWAMTFSFITAVMVSGLREAQELAKSVWPSTGASSVHEPEPSTVSVDVWRSMGIMSGKDARDDRLSSVETSATFDTAEEPH